MRLRLAIPLILVTLVCSPEVPAGTTRFAEHPDISPDGKQIAFQWGGDLWRVPATGGKATALTVHPALDDLPLYTPDGKTLVYTSNREGGNSLYAMDRDGGRVRRLTGNNSAAEYPSAVSGDGRHVYFYSSALGGLSILRVPLAGGTPAEVSVEIGENQYFPSVDAAEKRLVFCRRSSPSAVARINYSGSCNADLWLAELAPTATGYRQLTHNPGHDLWPQLSPDGKTLYWISAPDGRTSNVYRMRLDSGTSEGEAITHFESDAVRCLRLSRNGKWLVFVHDFEIYRMSTDPGSQPQRVKVDLPGVPVEKKLEPRTFDGNGVSEFAASPDGKKLALVVDSDIYLAAPDDNPTTRPVQPTACRETQPAWHPDNRTLVYVSMRKGNRDLVAFDTVEGRETWSTSTDGDEAWPMFSPDGRHLAYFSAGESIVVVSWPTREEQLSIPLAVPEATMYRGRVFNWSPDSRWLVYRGNEPQSSRSVMLWALDATAPRRLSVVVRELGRAIFSGKGDKVVYGAALGSDGELLCTDLTEHPQEFPEDKLDALFADAKPKSASPEVAAASRPRVPEIQWQDLEERTYVLGTSSFRESSAVAIPMSDEILVTQPDGIYRVNLEPSKRGQKTRVCAEGGRGLTVTADGKLGFFLSGGHVCKLDIKGGKVTPLLHRVERMVDAVAERDAAFVEAWWALDRHFYDPKLHGVNWPAVKAKYQQLLPSVVNNADFNQVLEYMLGELHASHMNSYPDQGDYSTASLPTAWIGIRFDPVRLENEGKLVISQVEPHSPATRVGAQLSPGLEIVAVDGRAVDTRRDAYALFDGAPGRKITLEVRSATRDDPSVRKRAVRAASTGDLREVRYANWVRDGRRRVEEWSGGRLGYLHVRQMDDTAMEAFIRDLRKRLAGKEGAVIDVRNNPGGFIAYRLLMVLAQKPWSVTKIRGNPPVSENWLRGYSLEMPAACLINQNSFSNAEMFAEGFRYLKLGPVVGVDTAGGVIGTGSYLLVNGYRIRMPQVGVYTAGGENLENQGRKPDIFMDITPDDRLRDDDPQLHRAVDAVLAELNTR